MFEEVHNESLSQDTRDSFQPVVTSRPSFYSSVEHSIRPSFVGTSTTGYDDLRGEGTNDGSCKTPTLLNVIIVVIELI